MMKRSKLLGAFTAIFFLCIPTFAQDYYYKEVKLNKQSGSQKESRLAKMLKKESSKITSLKIKGFVKDLDMQYVGLNLVNLKTLDLSECESYGAPVAGIYQYEHGKGRNYFWLYSQLDTLKAPRQSYFYQYQNRWVWANPLPVKHLFAEDVHHRVSNLHLPDHERINETTKMDRLKMLSLADTLYCGAFDENVCDQLVGACALARYKYKEEEEEYEYKDFSEWIKNRKSKGELGYVFFKRHPNYSVHLAQNNVLVVCDKKGKKYLICQSRDELKSMSMKAFRTWDFVNPALLPYMDDVAGSLGIVSADRFTYKNYPKLHIKNCNKIEEDVFLLGYQNEQGQHVGEHRLTVVEHEAYFENCKEIHSFPQARTIRLSGVEKIGKNAFKCCRLDSLIFDTPYAPIYDGNYGDLDLVFIQVPKGARKNFRVGAWADYPIHEAEENESYKFFIEEPGTLDKCLTEELQEYIGSLTLSGILFDTDFDVINQCRSLRKLDLTDVLIFESPETAKKRHAESQVWLMLFSMAANANANDIERDYKLGQANSMDIAKANFLRDFCSSAFKSSLEIPAGVEKELMGLPPINLPSLRELAFPNYLKQIPQYFGRRSSSGQYVLFNLQKISLPKSLIKIGEDAFAYCPLNQMVTLEFPAGLSVVERGAFYNTQCHIFDFRKCAINKLNWPSNGYKRLTFYFSLRDGRDIHLGPNAVIHIPKGSKAGWAHLDDTCILIDDL